MSIPAPSVGVSLGSSVVTWASSAGLFPKRDCEEGTNETPEEDEEDDDEVRSASFDTRCSSLITTDGGTVTKAANVSGDEPADPL